MKFLQILLILLIATVSIQNISAQELPVHMNKYEKQNQKFLLDYKNFINPSESTIHKYQNKKQGAEYTTLFELANGFSFYSNGQHPFIWDATSQQYLLISRGQNGSTATEDNLNNLFVRSTDDFGATWSDPILVYDHLENNNNLARYPSVYPGDYDGDLIYIYASPTTNGDGWTGYIDGFYGENSGNLNVHTENFEYDGFMYEWGTQSNIYSYITDSEFFNMVAVSPFPQEDQRTTFNTSLLGFRVTLDGFNSFDGYFPDQLLPDNYEESLTTDNRSNALVKFTNAPNGDLVYSWQGNFLGDGVDRLSLAFMTSSDNGETWSDAEILPYDMITDFAASVAPNAQLDSTGLGSCYNMVVAEDGTITWVCIIQESDEMKTDEEILVRLSEITFSNGSWSISSIYEIEDPTLWYYKMADGTNTNQMFRELRLAESFDGTKLFVKWVQMAEQLNEDSQEIERTHDVFVTAKNRGGEWGPAVNVTDDFALNRLVWIPNFVPNDLQNIPFLEVRAKSDPAWDAATKRTNEFIVDVQQEVVTYMVSYDPNSTETTPENIFEINNIYPNPATDNINIQFSMNMGSQVEIEFYNMLGEKLTVIESGYMTSGTHSIRFEVSGFASGTYNVSIVKDGQRLNKLVNIVR